MVSPYRVCPTKQGPVHKRHKMEPKKHKKRSFLTYLCLFVILIVPFVVRSAFVAQTVYRPGRLWDNKTPDFRGIWQVRETAYVNIEGHSGGKGIAPSKSIIVDPPNGKIPYTAEAIAKRQENY